jgi:hypothetical protein
MLVIVTVARNDRPGLIEDRAVDRALIGCGRKVMGLKGEERLPRARGCLHEVVSEA